MPCINDLVLVRVEFAFFLRIVQFGARIGSTARFVIRLVFTSRLDFESYMLAYARLGRCDTPHETPKD